MFQLFSSRAELEEWAKKRGREHGCAVVVQRPRPRAVDLGCNRGGEPKLTATIRRIGSIKKGCLFKLKGRHNRVGNFWKLEVVNETHNHDPFVFKEGHAYLMRMTDEMVDMVARLHVDGLKTSKIGPLLRRQFPEACVIEKDIHNLIESWRRENTVGDTPMQVFESFLINNEFVYHTRENPATNCVEDVFFCHNTSHKMWHAFPHLLLIDTTYNTNMYKWPFVQKIHRRRRQTSMGLSCAYEVERHLDTLVPIPLKSIDPFWRKLDFDPVVPQVEEEDFEAEIEELKKTVLIRKDRKQKRCLLSKIWSVLPSNSNKKEPEKR
ncbi:uncharacterized protein LOC143628323 [Bidens hawaiensis]|uniref:uncharacterized protein LOC143628323 n=1 Tax=Bidens hawaiensis TaxID=980011 RepID=UPI00404B8CED